MSSNFTPIPNTYDKKMASYLNEVMSGLKDLDKRNKTSEKVGYLAAGLQGATAIAGMFMNPPQIESNAKSNYTIDQTLAATANQASADALSNRDDYDARLRIARNIKAKQAEIVAMSGGNRGFVAANTAALADAENQANLAVDAQLAKEKAQELNAAANLQQISLFDRLNKSREEMAANELNLKTDMFNIGQKREHVQGIANLISSGLNTAVNTAATGTANEAINKSLQMQLAAIMLRTGQQFPE